MSAELRAEPSVFKPKAVGFQRPGTVGGVGAVLGGGVEVVGWGMLAGASCRIILGRSGSGYGG